jgi:hypothetical protein
MHSVSVPLFYRYLHYTRGYGYNGGAWGGGAHKQQTVPLPDHRAPRRPGALLLLEEMSTKNRKATMCCNDGPSANPVIDSKIHGDICIDTALQRREKDVLRGVTQSSNHFIRR